MIEIIRVLISVLIGIGIGSLLGEGVLKLIKGLIGGSDE